MLDYYSEEFDDLFDDNYYDHDSCEPTEVEVEYEFYYNSIAEEIED